MAIHPVAIKNTFARHLVLWAIFLPVLTLIFLPLLLPEQNIDPAEVKMMQDLNVDVGKLTASANSTFAAAFMSNGLMQASERLFTPTPVAGMPFQTSFPAKWMRGIWLIIYKCIWRIHALTQIFLLPLLGLSVAAAVDGIAVRARKSYSFQRSNPLFFYSSMHTAVLVLGLFVFLPLAPLTLTSNLLTAMLIGLTLAVWVASSNFQTGA